MVTFDKYQGASSPIPDEVVKRANDQYWNSDTGVNQLARELDLSKGTLYEILAPLPSRIPCPHCDGELGFANRTARRRHILSCAGCGLEVEKERVLEAIVGDTALADAIPLADTSLPAEPSSDPASTPAPSRGLGTLLALTALAGVGVGLILGGFLRRR